MFSTLKRASNLIASSLSPVDTLGSSAPAHGFLASEIEDLEGLAGTVGAFGPSDLPALIDAVRNMTSKGIDDRLFLLEKLLFVMSRMPADSETNIKLQQFFIDALYKDLPHPPAAYLAPPPLTLPDGWAPEARSYNYRSTNGSTYSQAQPTLGMAGSPYARTVPTTSTAPPSSLPDPGLAFDLLLSRPPTTPSNPYDPHPGGLSSMFFGIANLVIHSIFDTSRRNPLCNDTASYVDLAPLYGNDVSGMKRRTSEVRRGDGSGRLWEDVWADERLVFMPPQTAVVLVLLCRNHNYIAEKILSINERGTYAPPAQFSTLAPEKLKLQDEEIFQRARLVNCMTFAKVVLYDYVGGILGLTRDGSPFRLNLPEQIRNGDHALSPTGEGNQISAEFNILYRWHASTSAPDEQWITGVMQGMCEAVGGGVRPETMTPGQFVKGAAQFMKTPESVREWPVGSLKRDPSTGRFRDSDLANIIMSCTDSPAHAFGARRTPAAMRVIEVMTIMQGRQWGVCTLNEFREFFGLRPYKDFREWNSKEEIYKAAEALYHDINSLELHVGLQAEETKPAMPGAGLCPSYTMSRAILADAVVLIRSDPFLTTEFNPYNATSWGFQDCSIDAKDGSYGGMLSKLLLRHLPNDFLPGSAYTHFPLLTPSAMFEAMAKRGDPAVSKYDWKRPGAPGALGGVYRGLSVQERVYGSPTQRVERLVGGVKIDWSLVKNAMMAGITNEKWTDGFARITTHLIRAKSVSRPRSNVRQLDVVQDVLNLVPVYFLANDLLGLPLKTHENPTGIYRPQQLYEMFANVSSYVLFYQDTTQEWSKREKAMECAKTIIGEIKANLERLDYGIFSVTGLVDTIMDYFTARNDRSGAFLSSLLQAAKKAHLSHDVVAASLFAGVVPSVSQYSAVLAQIVDFYLDEQQSENKAKLVEMASFPSSAADSQFLSFAQKAIQSTPPVTVSSQKAPETAATNGTNGVSNGLAQGSGATFSPGTEGLMNSKFLDKTAPFILRAIFGLKNVRRAPGSSGRVPKFVQEIEGVPQTFYIDNQSGLSPFPTGLLLQYDV